MKHLHIIKLGSGSIFIKIGQTVLTVIGGILVARILGPKEYGIYAYIMAIITLLSIPITAGLPNLIVREVAKAAAEHRIANIITHLKWALKLIFSYFIIILLISLFVIFFPKNNSSSYLSIYLVGIWLIPMMAILAANCAAIRGLNFVLLGQLPQNIIIHAIFLIFLGAFLLFKSLNALNVMELRVLAFLIALIISFFLLNHLSEKHVNNVTSINRKFPYKSLATLTLIGGFQIILNNIDILILGHFRNSVNVGVYRAAVQAANLVVFGLFAINQILHPRFATLYQKREIDKLQEIVTVSSKIIFVLAAIPVLLFIGYGHTLLELFFGPGYESGATALTILALGQLMNAAFGSVGALLNMSGHEVDTLKGMMTAIMVNVVANFILIPKYGIEGAATGTALSCIIWNIILWIFVKKRLDIQSIGWLSR